MGRACKQQLLGRIFFYLACVVGNVLAQEGADEQDLLGLDLDIRGLREARERGVRCVVMTS